MLDVTKIIASIFGGCKLGLFLLGFFTTRVSEQRASSGADPRDPGQHLPRA